MARVFTDDVLHAAAHDASALLAAGLDGRADFHGSYAAFAEGWGVEGPVTADAGPFIGRGSSARKR